MRYILPILALSICFTACEKKQPSRACYYCVRNDSVTSNIPKLADPKHFTTASNLCDITTDQRDVYEKINTHNDTTFNHGDTVVVNHVKTTCTFNF
ncbi:MAG: hypothetical protein JWQ38_2191 [Flavipsychrobacter sp.]|nr:hypothetical protein [Flavipsychrobacter sp.]